MKAIGASVSFPPNTTTESQNEVGRLPRILVTTVGNITAGPTGEKLLGDGFADAVFVGRAFLKNPGLVWAWAEELRGSGQALEIQLAHQIGWGFQGRGKKT